MDASNSANAPSETHAIAPTGDIILVVGEEKTELRVHSVCMRTASRVFDAMFGPRFLEGQPSNGDPPKKIRMPDDDATAMTIICNVIHHRNDLMPNVLEPGDSAEILLVADKYDCVLLVLKQATFQWLDSKERTCVLQVLKQAISQWRDSQEPVTPLDLGSLLIAAYVCNDSDAFRPITQKLITCTSQPYHLVIDTEFGGPIPSSILQTIYYWLRESRTRIRVSIQDVLFPEVARCCGHPSEKVWAQMKELTDNNMLGASLFEVPIDHVVAKAERLVHLTSHCEEEMSCKHTHIREHSKEPPYSKLKALTASVGLCLRCVRSGNRDPSLPCDLDHKDEV